MGPVVYVGLCLLGCFVLGSSGATVEGANNTQVDARSFCSNGAYFFRRNCYQYFSAAVQWYTAEFACQQLRPDGHLVSFSSSSEEKLVSAYIRGQSTTATHVWIGLIGERKYKELNWEWTDGSPYISGTALWDNRTPSTSTSSAECLLLANIRNPSTSTRWTQQNCDSSWPYVCKYKA